MEETKLEEFDISRGGQTGGISAGVNSEPVVTSKSHGLNDTGSGLASVSPKNTEESNGNFRTATEDALPIKLVTDGGKNTSLSTGTTVANGSNVPTSGIAHGEVEDSKEGSHHSMTPYYQQFTNMNAHAQAQEVIRNSYQPYHRPPANDDPEVAQAMLNLGSQNANEMPSGDNGNDPENAGNLPSFSSYNPPASSLVGGKSDFSDVALSPYQHNHQVEQHRRSESSVYTTEISRSVKDFHDDHYQEIPHAPNASDQDLCALKDNDGIDDTTMMAQNHHFHNYPRQQHHSYHNYGFAGNNQQNPPPHGHHHLGFPIPLQPYRLDHQRDDSMLSHQQNGHSFYSAHQATKPEPIVPQNIGNIPGTQLSSKMPQQGHYPDHFQRSGNASQYMVTAGGAHFIDSFNHGHNHLQQQQQQQQVLQVTQPKMDTMQKKRKRPVDMPRRPLSAYNFFFSEERLRLLAEIPNPDTDQASCSNDITTDTSKGFEDKQEIHDVSSASSERLLKIRDAKVVKRRPHRKSHGKIAFKDLAREVGKRWKALNDVEKSRYNDLAEKDLQRYNEQMKDYNSKRNRFAGASYQTSPGPLPPQFNVTGMNIGGLSDDKTTPSSLRTLPLNMSRGHMQTVQSNSLNHLNVQHPNVFNSVSMHHPQQDGTPQPIDSNDANFFLSTSASIDAPSFDTHLLQSTNDPYHPAHSQHKHGNNAALNVCSSIPSIETGTAPDSVRLNDPAE